MMKNYCIPSSKNFRIKTSPKCSIVSKLYHPPPTKVGNPDSAYNPTLFLKKALKVFSSKEQVLPQIRFRTIWEILKSGLDKEKNKVKTVTSTHPIIQKPNISKVFAWVLRTGQMLIKVK
jgi:hypothetical protein